MTRPVAVPGLRQKHAPGQLGIGGFVHRVGVLALGDHHVQAVPLTEASHEVVPWLTEFGMLVTAEDSPAPLIDTTVAHAEAAVEITLRDSDPYLAR